MSDLVVYTAIFGGKDKYKEPPAGDYDVVLFADEKVKVSPHVRVVQVPLLGDPRRMSRRFKMLSHVYFPEAAYTLWMDGSIEARGIDIRKTVLDYLADADLAAFKHPLRKCTYEEAAACIEYKLEDPGLIAMQMDRYRNVGFPANLGLVESGVLFRRHTEGVRKFNEAWHEEYRVSSNRDQLCFYYVTRNVDVRFLQIPESIRRGAGQGGFYVGAHEKMEAPVEAKPGTRPKAPEVRAEPRGDLASAIASSLEPDVWNKNWLQCRRFGGGMAVEFEVGLLLEALVRCIKPGVVLETGAHKGFSTAMIARALLDNGAGHLHTMDIVDHGIVADLHRFGLGRWFTFYRGPSVNVIQTLAKTIQKADFVFLDASHKKDDVIAEVEAVLPMTQSGTYIAFHDSRIDPGEAAAVQEIRKRFPAWEYIRIVSSRGFDLVRVP